MHTSFGWQNSELAGRITSWSRASSRLWPQQIESGPIITSCVILGKSLSISVPTYPESVGIVVTSGFTVVVTSSKGQPAFQTGYNISVFCSLNGFLGLLVLLDIHEERSLKLVFLKILLTTKCSQKSKNLIFSKTKKRLKSKTTWFTLL